jgi:hypothetical protein
MEHGATVRRQKGLFIIEKKTKSQILVQTNEKRIVRTNHLSCTYFSLIGISIKFRRSGMDLAAEGHGVFVYGH